MASRICIWDASTDGAPAILLKMDLMLLEMFQQDEQLMLLMLQLLMPSR